MQNEKITEYSGPLLLPRIRQIEEILLSDYMIGRIFENSLFKQWVSTIMLFLYNSRQYYLLGYTRKAYRSYLRAFLIYKELEERLSKL